jgi:nucleoside-diphosphate-sugar epimerase
MGLAFVTGGTGFVGRHLIEHLLAEDWQVVALHRRTSNTQHLMRPGVHLVEGSITDPDSLQHSMPKQPDVVFHLAASTNLWSPRNRQQTEVNAEGTRNLVAMARQRQAGRFIHVSSIAAFGIHRERITEETPSTAAGSWINYLRTKRLAELEVLQAAENGLDAVVVNPANIMGPYDRRNWGGIVRQIARGDFPGLPSGEGSFCHVHSVARALLAAYHSGGRGERYLLGGEDASYLKLAAEVGELLGRRVPQKTMSDWFLRAVARGFLWWSYLSRKEPPLTPEKVAIGTSRLVCSSDKAARALGYRTVSFREMLTDCIRWLQEEKLL